MSFSIREVTKEAFWITPRMSFKNLFKLGGISFLFMAMAIMSVIVTTAVTGVDLDLSKQTTLDLGPTEYVYLFFLMMYGVSIVVSVPVKFNRYILLQENPRFWSLGGKYALQSACFTFSMLIISVLALLGVLYMFEAYGDSVLFIIACGLLFLGMGWFTFRFITLGVHISIGNGFPIKKAFSETKGLFWKILGALLLYILKLWFLVLVGVIIVMIIMLPLTPLLQIVMAGMDATTTIIISGLMMIVMTASQLYVTLLVQGIAFTFTPVLFKKIQESKLAAS